MRKAGKFARLLFLAVFVWGVNISVVHAATCTPCFDVTDHGAVGDGKARCTEAIQKAIDACHAAGGGMVYLPAGRYLSGALFLKSNVTLHISEGATLLASTGFDDFPPFKPGWRIQSDDTQRSSLITGVDIENIAVTGRGTLNGQGKPWWDALREDKNSKDGQPKILTYGRPRVINFYRCRDILIEGVTIVDSPSWTVHPVGCENLVVNGISIINPESGPNTDGVNPESCRNVQIANCFIDTGDDCITLKSGEDEEGRLKARPTENVTITNCVMYKGHGAVVIGSEMSGGIRNVTASNIVCVGTDRAVRIKSTRGRGGVVENIRFANFVVDNVKEPIYITNFYTKTKPEPVSERTPIFRDIAISHFTIKNSPCTAKILGLPEMPIQRLRITDLTASTRVGFSCDSVAGLELRDVHVDADRGPAFEIKNCKDVELRAVKTTDPRVDEPVVRLENVQDAFIQGCRAYSGTGSFLELKGKMTRGIALAGNELSAAKNPFLLKDGAEKGAVVEK
ncbi:MAG: glycoside hydrolase family 28 protein [Phycisphaerales bacterium]|nr:MAG: glycoside hydrolase family 28 protein [Phycisphaerales bacterium]